MVRILFLGDPNVQLWTIKTGQWVELLLKVYVIDIGSDRKCIPDNFDRFIVYVDLVKRH